MKKIKSFLALIVLLSVGNLAAQITTYPYVEDFESGAAGWTITGSSSWALGVPGNAIINSAGSGASSWVTNLLGDYSSSENGAVQSPVFDFSALNVPSIRARIIWESETSFDGMVLQSSIDGGLTFQNVGAFGDPSNWFNDSSIGANPGGQQEGWSGDGSDGSGGWVTINHVLTGLNNQSSVILRFAFASDGGVEAEGVGFDFVEILEITCDQPTALNVTNNVGTSVDLGWTENGMATDWDIEWGTAGFNQGTGTIIPNTTTNPQTLSGLMANTNYDFYVRAICGVGDTSGWAGPFNFLTNCAAFTAPFFENVEAHATTTSFTSSSCWSATSTSNYDWNIDGNGSTPSGSTGPLGAFSGNNFFYVEASGSSAGTIAELISPVIDITSLTVPTIEFQYHMFGIETGTLQVDVWDGSAWINVDAIVGQQQTAQADPWIKRIINISAFTGNIQIRFTAISAGTFEGDISLDDINVIQAPTCAEPDSLHVTNLLANSVNLGWNENGSATAWDIEWGGTGFIQGTGALINNTTTNPHALSGLIGNTSYEFYVRADCGTGDSSIWIGPFNFLTPCSSFIAPWIDSVELHTPSTNLVFSECWNASSSAGYDWNINGNSLSTPSSNTGPSISFSDSNYFYVEASSGNAGDEAVLVSPNINISALTNPVLEFYYHMFGAEMGNLYIDISDGVTWTTIDSIINQQQTAETDPWIKRFLSLSAYTGTIQIRYRAIRGVGSEGDISLDDISVLEAPICPQPSLLTALNISADSVDLSWTENGSATSWEIEWGLTGFTQGSGTVVPSITSTTYDLNGLMGNTSYSFYARAICGMGDTSLQAGPFVFSTPCAAVMAPFFDDVELHQGTTGLSSSQCWNASSASGYSWNIEDNGSTPSVFTGPIGAFSGDNYFYIETQGNVGDIANLVSPNIDITTLTGATLEFYYHMYGSDIGTLFTDVWNGTTWINIDAIIGEQQTAETDPWVRQLIDLTGFTGIIQIRFRAVSIGTTRGDISLDNISIIQTATCPEPSLLTITNLTSSSTELSWTENGTATEWEIEFGPVGFTPGTGTTSMASNNLDTLTGLNPATFYDVYVRAICAVTDTSLAGTLNFVSLCSPIVAPWIDNFETHLPTTSLDSSICWSTTATNAATGYEWNISGAGQTPTGSTGPSSAFSGDNYFYIEGSNGNDGDTATLISPEIDVTNIVPVLEFRYHMFGADIGTLITEVWNGSTWVSVDVINGEQQTFLADPFLLRSIELPTFTGVIQVRFRAVRAIGGSIRGDIALDDIEIKQSLVTTCIASSNLNATNIGANTADLDWTNSGSAFIWEIEWGLNGFTQGTGTFVSTGSTPLNIVGLDSNTTYCFYATAICGVGDSSATVGPFCFTTSCYDVDLGANDTICESGSTTIDAGITGTDIVYNWSNGATTQTITLDTNDLGNADTPPDTISVTVTDTVLGCSSTGMVVVFVSDTGVCSTVGIGENGSNISLSIFPNPSKGFFTINVNTFEANQLAIEVINLQGQVVFSKSDFNNVNHVNQTINLKDNAKGIYFVNVTSDKGTVTNKIVVQ